MIDSKINIYKDVLRISYLILMTTFLLASIYFIFGSAYATAYGGGKISWIELIWVWKGLVATFIFSSIAFFGLKRPNKLGVYFSYSLPIGLGVYFIITIINTTLYKIKQGAELDLENILELIISTVLIIGIPWIMILSTSKIEKKNFQLKKFDIGIISGLALILILAWYFMFNFFW